MTFPWKRQRGYATRALRLLLPQIRAEGLAYVELTTEADNLPSRRVIEANGGELIERFHKASEYGGGESMRFRILLLSLLRCVLQTVYGLNSWKKLTGRK